MSVRMCVHGVCMCVGKCECDMCKQIHVYACMRAGLYVCATCMWLHMCMCVRVHAYMCFHLYVPRHTTCKQHMHILGTPPAHHTIISLKNLHEGSRQKLNSLLGRCDSYYWKAIELISLVYNQHGFHF